MAATAQLAEPEELAAWVDWPRELVWREPMAMAATGVSGDPQARLETAELAERGVKHF